MDYVYQAMGCRISLLQESSQEAQYILRYINTSNYSYGEFHAMFTTFLYTVIHLTILMVSPMLCSLHFQTFQCI